MVLGLLNGYKKHVPMKERKKLLKKHELCTKGKFILRRMEEFMNFRIKEKLMLWIFGNKKKYFPMREVGRKMIFV